MAVFRGRRPGLGKMAGRRPPSGKPPNGLAGATREPVGGPPADKECELCLRESPKLTVHHLVPRSRGGRFGPKAQLCSTCHRQLHALFSESTLAQVLGSLESIRANPQMAGYLKWVRRQQAPANFRVRRSNSRS